MSLFITVSILIPSPRAGLTWIQIAYFQDDPKSRRESREEGKTNIMRWMPWVPGADSTLPS